jgi:hypothetical protein
MGRYSRAAGRAIIGRGNGVVGGELRRASSPGAILGARGFVIGFSKIGGEDEIGDGGAFVIGQSRIGGNDRIGLTRTHRPFLIGTSSIGGEDRIGA